MKQPPAAASFSDLNADGASTSSFSSSSTGSTIFGALTDQFFSTTTTATPSGASSTFSSMRAAATIQSIFLNDAQAEIGNAQQQQQILVVPAAAAAHSPQTAALLELPSSMEAEEEEELILQNCFESERFMQFQYTMDDLLLAASTASTLFNLLVIFCAFRLFKRSGDTMHIFIINMTFGDLLLTVFCHPNEFLIRKHAFLRHVRLCAIIHYCNWLGLAVSGLSLTLLNVDKLIYFRWPLSYERAMSKRRAVCLCVGVWAVSLGFVSYVWVKNIVFVTSDCMLQMAENSQYFYEIFMILFCVLPVSSSLVVSTYLFRLTRQKLNAPVGPAGQVDMPTFKNKLKSLVFIFATTAWTSFSLLPYRIFNICRIHLFDWPNIGCDQRVLMNWVAWILLYLLTLNPIVNPLITTLIYAPYRLHLKKLLLHIPGGNRFQYNAYRTAEVVTENSQIPFRRRRRRGGSNGTTTRRFFSANSTSTNHTEFGSSSVAAAAAASNNHHHNNHQNLYRHHHQQTILLGGEGSSSCCAGDSSTTTSTSSRRHPPSIPLVNIDGAAKREFSSSVDAPLSAKSSCANSSITNSSSSKSAAAATATVTTSTAKFIFVDEEQDNEMLGLGVDEEEEETEEAGFK